MEGRLLVFAKAPVPGRVKTRLIPGFGARGAARLYADMVRRTLATANRGGCPVELWCAPDARHSFFAACRREFGVTLRVQSRGDLGARMHHALRAALRGGPHAVLIGGDCPALGVEDLRGAFAALRRGADAVLGPAEDGGYVLIGLRRPEPRLFSGMVWGGPHVLATTRRRLLRLGLDWYETRPRWDVDRPADVRRLRREGR